MPRKNRKTTRPQAPKAPTVRGFLSHTDRSTNGETACLVCGATDVPLRPTTCVPFGFVQ